MNLLLLTVTNLEGGTELIGGMGAEVGVDDVALHEKTKRRTMIPGIRVNFMFIYIRASIAGD